MCRYVCVCTQYNKIYEPTTLCTYNRSCTAPSGTHRLSLPAAAAIAYSLICICFPPNEKRFEIALFSSLSLHLQPNFPLIFASITFRDFLHYLRGVLWRYELLSCNIEKPLFYFKLFIG